MDHILLQLVGGGLYLLNKVFLDVMEYKRGLNEEGFWFWKKMAWLVYLLGLPFILVIFVHERNWVFAAIELGGAPSMLCGLVVAMRRRDAPPWLDWIAIIAIPIGLGYSFYDLGTITTLNQLLEIAGGVGFLIGTYLLAKDRQIGYWFFMIMNIATGVLLYRQNYLLFVPQQIISVALIIDAYRRRRSKSII